MLGCLSVMLLIRLISPSFTVGSEERNLRGERLVPNSSGEIRAGLRRGNVAGRIN